METIKQENKGERKREREKRRTIPALDVVFIRPFGLLFAAFFSFIFLANFSNRQNNMRGLNFEHVHTYRIEAKLNDSECWEIRANGKYPQ